MKSNCLVDVRGQLYEKRARMQNIGVQRLLRAAGIPEGLRTVVDLGCGMGDTTLGIAQAIPNARIIAVEEVRRALRIAKAKFGLPGPIDEFWAELPEGWLSSFQTEAMQHKDRVSFVNASIEELSKVLGREKADLIVGFQALQWLSADETGLPKAEVLRAIYESLAAGGVFLAGTTAFVQIDPDEKIDGMTMDQYSIDNHPFVKMVYEGIETAVSRILGYVPEPVTSKPPLLMDGLIAHLSTVGFSSVSTGAFLVTPGREEVIDNVVKLRPEHQGRLEGIDDLEVRKRIVGEAIADANITCDIMISKSMPDPRLVETNISDAIPYVKATKLASEEQKKQNLGPTHISDLLRFFP